MSALTIGDLSNSYAMRQRNASIKDEINRLTTELATGQVANVRDILAGNYSQLTEIERRTEALGGYKVATTEASLFSGALQQALGVIQEFSTSLSASLLTAGVGSGAVSGGDAVFEAEHALSSIISAVNTNSGGRYLLSGTSTDRPPLPQADVLLAALRTEIGGATTPTDILAAAQVWFDDPNGFEATIYQGSAEANGPFELSQTDSAKLDIRAVDPNLREVLKSVAVAALANDATLGLDAPSQSNLFAQLGQSLLVAQDDVVSLRAKVGFFEAHVEGVAARNAAELTSLEYTKAGLLEIDPYEAATQLEEAQFQLQSLYSVTVRMSQLSLVNFL